MLCLNYNFKGEIAGYWEAYKIGGKLPWKTLFEPTIKV